MYTANDFKELCVPHYAELVNFAMRLTNGHRARALDVVHDSLERALQNWERWTPNGDEPSRSARAWLYKIVSNTFASEYRKGKTQWRLIHDRPGEIMESITACLAEYNPRKTRDEWYLLTVMTATDDPHADEIGHEVQEALGRIHPAYREMVELVFLQGMTMEEASKHLGIPFGTARSRLERGRMALARILGPYVRQEFGMLYRKREDRKSRRGTRKDTATLKAFQIPETDPDGVDGVMGEDDALAFAFA